MLRYLHKIKKYLLLFLELQLVISICLLPIFIAWGLPLSHASFIGNLIFGPFLSSFIFLATLFTLAEIMQLPTTLFTTLLNRLTEVWSYLLSWGSKKFLIGFSYKMILPAIFGTVMLGIMYAYSKWKQPKRLVVILLIYCMPFVLDNIVKSKDLHFRVYNGKQKVDIICKNNRIIMYDTGALGAKKSYESWIDFTLIPALIKHTGSMTIDTLVTYKTNPRYLQAIKYLHKALTIKNHITLQQPTMH